MGKFLNSLIICLLAVSAANAYDLDPHYKFSAPQATASPYKNTWGAYQTDLYSGSFGYSYQIPAPPGTNGLAPKISLSYNNHSAKGKAGWIGAGWDIPQSYIQRHIQYTRKDTSDDTFELYLDGAKHDLIFVAAENRFHTKVESYLKVTFQSTGAANEKGGYWSVIARDGTEYRFGYNLDSETLVQATDSSFDHYVWRWSLDRVKDTNGNCIFLSYKENPFPNDRGAVYLDKIEYNNDRKRSIEFKLENADKPDAYLTIEQGSETRESRRLGEILVKVDGALARRYVFGYGINETQNRSLLKSITPFGSDGTSSLPPVTFRYKALDKGFAPGVEWRTPQNRFIRRVTSSEETEEHRNDTVSDTFDVNGDGLPDLVRYDTSTDPGFGDHWGVWFNQKNGFAANLIRIPVPQDWFIRNSNVYLPGTQAPDTKTAPMDFNRDGYVDFVRADGGSNVEIRYGNGSSFSPSVSIATSTDAGRVWIRNVQRPEGVAPNVEQDFFDMNGDGLPDIVEKIDNYHWKVWRNTGSAFVDFGIWDVAYGTGWLEDFTRDVDTKTQTTHMDMNGDGLPDIVKGTTGEVWLNTGSDFIYAGVWGTAFNGFVATTTNSGDVKQDMIDLNGDGLPDIIRNWKVQFNTGKGFMPEVTWPGDELANGLIRNLSNGLDVERDVFDLDGDGLPDLVRKDGSQSNWLLYKNKSGQADLLEKVTDALGGTVSVVYAPSVQFNNTRLPFNFWVVTSLAKNNGMTGPHALATTTQFSYAQGLYDFPTREFRGFGQVTVTRPDGGREIHAFHQDEGKKGKEKQVEVRDATDRPFAATLSDWSDSANGGVYVARLLVNQELTYDGVATGPKTRRTEFVNHDNFGNVGLEKRLGDPGTAADDAYLYREFAINPDQWIVDRVSHTTVTAGAGGAKLRESWFGYDNGAPGAVPTKGNLTQEEHFVEGDSPVIHHQYDAFGNRARTTDAELRSSFTLYDSVFQTFPASITNAKGQVTQRQYNPVNGEMLEETDPNGFRTQTLFDIFQRKIAEVRPYDSVALPTTRIQYDLDGVAPERIVTFRREVSGQSGTRNSAQFVDGFGNLIQSRSEPSGGTAWITEDLFYDSMDRLKQRSNPYLSGSGDTYATPVTTTPATVYDYDVMGRPVRVTNPDASQVSRNFDHWTVTETDENSHNKSYAFDAFQRLLQVNENNAGAVYTTRYGYDAMGQLRGIIDHLGNATAITYDALGRKTAMNDPDLGAWSYAYDRVSNLRSQTDARGITTRFSYDALNRKTLVDYPTDPDVSYAYDEGTVGTLSRVTHSLGSTRYQYDQRLRKIEEKRAMDNFSWITGWQNDALDRVTAQINPDGEIVQYNYNAQGLLSAIPGVVTALEYDASGRMTRKAYANARETTYSYHPQNLRLKRIFSAGIQDLNYLYDAVGNVASISDGVTAKNEVFGYDGLDRLTSAGDAGYNRQYSYNAIGNMLNVNIDGFNSVYTYGSVGIRPHAVTSMTLPGLRVESMVMAAGSSFTLQPEVSINAIVLGTPVDYMASEKADFAGAAWKPLVMTPSIVLSTGFGRKTVYFKVRNGSGESNVKSAGINYAPDVLGTRQPTHLQTDTDMDGIPDAWEIAHGLNPNNPNDARLDTDGDGLTNLQEFLLGTNPNVANALGDPPPRSASYMVRSGRMHMGGGRRGSENFSVAVDAIGDRLNGVAARNYLQVAPAEQYFGAILLGTTSEVKTFALKNFDSSSHIVNQVVLGGAHASEYNKGSDGCSGRTLASGAQCQFTVTFRPIRLGFRLAAVGIAADVGSVLQSAPFRGFGGFDSDGDGMSDAFERAYGFDPFNAMDANQDADGDGVSNLAEFLAGTNPRSNAPNVSLDVDGNGVLDAATDGLMILRSMFGLTGSAVTTGALGTDAKRTTWEQIEPYLDAYRAGTALPSCSFDVDGNGTQDALTDGLILLRAMLRLTGTAVTSGVIGTGATRTTWAEIQPYLNLNCGTNFAP